MEQSPSLQLVGATLSRRWRITRLLGEGGMGAVYEAQGVNGEGARALKVLHPEFVAEESILQRFFAEAQACQSLGHPNIAQIYEHGRAEDGTPYLVMELLRGQPLSQYIHDRKLLTPEQAAPIVYGMLQALAAAHQQRIVHRDLKPDNVFLVDDGRGAGQFLVKVLDFGIAKVMDGAGGMGSKTRTGVLLGTPGYMSPEQIKNAKGVDPRSDLWSVGVMLFEMLTAKDVFPAENEFARLTAVLTQSVPPISSVAPHLAAWDPFFQRALAKDPAQRFQSAQEMAQALVQTAQAAHAQGQPASAVARNWGTVALPAFSQIPAASPQAPGSAQVANGRSAAPPTYGAGSGYGASPAPASATPQTYPSGGGSPAPQAARPMSAPPPPLEPYRPAAAGPATHMSAGAMAPSPTLPGGSTSPQIEVVAPPPLGAPWWVVGAVGAGCLVVGFLIGFLVGG
jgi:serine/threonine-protein kinase